MVACVRTAHAQRVGQRHAVAVVAVSGAVKCVAKRAARRHAPSAVLQVETQRAFLAVKEGVGVARITDLVVRIGGHADAFAAAAIVGQTTVSWHAAALAEGAPTQTNALLAIAEGTHAALVRAGRVGVVGEALANAQAAHLAISIEVRAVEPVVPAFLAARLILVFTDIAVDGDALAIRAELVAPAAAGAALGAALVDLAVAVVVDRRVAVLRDPGVGAAVGIVTVFLHTVAVVVGVLASAWVDTSTALTYEIRLALALEPSRAIFAANL